MEQFEYPKKVNWEEESYRDNYGKVMVAPLERGYSITIGNSLRRVLLSSIEGVAITSVKIDGIQHEFSAVTGVKEDVTDIVLNLKQVNLKSNIQGLSKTFSVTIKDKAEVIAADLFPGPEVTVLNPKLHIATVSSGKTFQLELTVSRGFGYVPVSRMNREGVPISVIQLAASFSPVTRVSYYTENTRVGQRVDYERLNMEIWTTGAVSPKEAVAQATAILHRHFNLIAGEKTWDAASDVAKLLPEGPETPNRGLNEFEFFSTKILNVLKSAGVEKVKHLTAMTAQEVQNIDGLGEKSVQEVEKFLKKFKLSLKEKA